MSTHRSLGKRFAAVLGAAAIGLVGLTGVANAADPVTGTGNIDPDQKTTLTINKFDGAEGAAGDGTVQQDTSGFGNPLAGVTFKIQKVTQEDGTAINLDTPEGWDLIKGVTADDVTKTPYALTDVKSVATKADGTISTELPHGLYYVTETDPGANNIISKTAPFLVTLPLPTRNGGWLYDVNVYPKNQVLAAPEKTINKTEDQTGVKVGDTVQYTITQTVPRLNEGETYNQAKIYDILDSAELAFDKTVSVSLNDVALSAAGYTAAPDGSSWSLSDDQLKTLKAGDVITVVFTAKVLKVTESGAVLNGPGNGEPGKPGYGSTFNGTTTPGNTTPYTYWGQLKVTKVDESGKELKDAEFAVYAEACPADNAAPTTDAVATGKSDTTGVVQWNSTPTSPLGLFVANSSDGPLQNPSKAYCLVETKAPAGFIIAANQTVTITPGTTLVPGDNDLTVKNVQQDHPKLPLTGANGELLMTIGGAALVLLAGGTALVARKRKHQA